MGKHVLHNFRVYSTFTDESNYERLAINTTAGTGATITPETAGTGGDNLSLTLSPAGTGNLILAADSSADINFFTATGPRFESANDADLLVTVSSNWLRMGGWGNNTFYPNLCIDGGGGPHDPHVLLYTAGAGILQLGEDHADTATDQTIQAHEVTTGAGPDLYLNGGVGSISTGSVIVNGLEVDSSAQISGGSIFLSGVYGGKGSWMSTNGVAGNSFVLSGGYYGFNEGGSVDLYLYRDAANTLAQRNSTNAQTTRFYRTYTDASNYERLALQSGSGYFEVAAETAGTGTDDINVQLTAAGDGYVYTDSGFVVSSGDAGIFNDGVSGDGFLFGKTDAHMSFYTGTDQYLCMATTGYIAWGSADRTETALNQLIARDLILGRDAAATLQLGQDHATTATEQTIKAHDVTTGAGANLHLTGGAGSTGRGIVEIGGSLSFPDATFTSASIGARSIHAWSNHFIIYNGSSTYGIGLNAPTSGVNINQGWLGFSNGHGSRWTTPELYLVRAGAATIQLGLDDATTATDQTIQAHSVTTGMGAGLILQGGSGSTGDGTVTITNDQGGFNGNTLIVNAVNPGSTAVLMDVQVDGTSQVWITDAPLGGSAWNIGASMEARTNGGTATIWTAYGNSISIGDSNHNVGLPGATFVRSSGGYGVYIGSGGSMPILYGGNEEGSHTLGIRNATSANTLRVYSTYTDSSNYERISLTGDGAGNTTIAAETAGTGTTDMDITLQPAGSGVIKIPNGYGVSCSTNDVGIYNDGAGDVMSFGKPSSHMSFATGFYQIMAFPERGYLGWGTAGASDTSTTQATSLDSYLGRRTAGVLRQIDLDGTNQAQTFEIYGAWTNDSNYERLAIAADGSGGTTITAESSGTGSTDMGIGFSAQGSGEIGIDSSSYFYVTTNYGIYLQGTGSSSYRLYSTGTDIWTRSGSLYFGVHSDTTGYITIGDASKDLRLTRGAAATLQLGTNHSTTPTGQTLKAHDVTTGTGADLTLSGGTGSTADGNVVLSAENVLISSLPTSDPSVTDALWNDTGTVVVSGSTADSHRVQVVALCWNSPGTDASTGTKKAYFRVPASMNGMDLITVHAEVATAGVTGTQTFDINKNGSSMLSTLITIDSNETGSDTAATAAVINTAQDNVATNDIISVDVDVIHSGTAAKGEVVTLEFQLP